MVAEKALEHGRDISGGHGRAGNSVRADARKLATIARPVVEFALGGADQPLDEVLAMYSSVYSEM